MSGSSSWFLMKVLLNALAYLIVFLMELPTVVIYFLFYFCDHESTMFFLKETVEMNTKTK